jgi:ribosome-associated toxin RatA of RatAB toxin-antitoxin module
VHSSIAIDVAASPDLVFALACDVTRWEGLLPHYARSRARGRLHDGTLLVDFVARRPLIGLVGLGLPVTWRARTWSEPEPRRLRFVHVAGATRGMDVTWRIEAGPAGRGAHVTIDHEFSPAVPFLAIVVDRFFTRPIAGRTLGTFRSIAEAVAEALESDNPFPTNQST